VRVKKKNEIYVSYKPRIAHLILAPSACASASFPEPNTLPRFSHPRKRVKIEKIAPKFAELNDDVLFGEVWSREEQLSARDRSMITIAALFSAGLYPQLKAHLALGKKHGITKEEAVEIVTQLAFYCGWPKAWSTFPMIEEIYGSED
jgi:4-carboxymuconolactone decarboxylase